MVIMTVMHSHADEEIVDDGLHLLPCLSVQHFWLSALPSRQRSPATAWETPWFMSVVCPTMRATVASATCWTTRSGAAGTKAALVPGHWCMDYTMNILPVRRNGPEIMKGLLLRRPALSNSTRSWKDPISGKLWPLWKSWKKLTGILGEASADEGISFEMAPH